MDDEYWRITKGRIRFDSPAMMIEIRFVADPVNGDGFIMNNYFDTRLKRSEKTNIYQGIFYHVNGYLKRLNEEYIKEFWEPRHYKGYYNLPKDGEE